MGARILLNGRRIDGLAPEEIVRSGIAVVPEGARLSGHVGAGQSPMGAVIPRAQGREMESLKEVFAMFPRLEERTAQLARTLSGGERQMLAIGRALMSCPDLLLLDEPSLGLQPSLVKGIMDAVRRINERGLTVLLIEQNVHFSLPISHRATCWSRGASCSKDREGAAAEPARARFLPGSVAGRSEPETTTRRSATSRRLRTVVILPTVCAPLPRAAHRTVRRVVCVQRPSGPIGDTTVFVPSDPPLRPAEGVDGHVTVRHRRADRTCPPRHRSGGRRRDDIGTVVGYADAGNYLTKTDKVVMAGRP